MAMLESTPDIIRITDLQIRCIIGINPEEREQKQDVIFNIALYANTQKAGQTDDINDTVNYKILKKKILSMTEGSSYYLIERLAEEAAAICFTDPKVDAVSVRVDKPGALRFAKSVSVEITRTRHVG